MMRFIRTALLTFVLLFFGQFAFGQTNATWKASVEHVSGVEYKALFTATIPAGFHMYDLGPYGNYGPNATTFEFETLDGIELIGTPTSIEKPKTKFDEMFGMEIGSYSGSVTFVQKFKVTAQQANIKGYVEWQLCDDQSCLAPTDWEFDLKVTAKPGAFAAAPKADTKPAQPTTTVDSAEGDADGADKAATEADEEAEEEAEEESQTEAAAIVPTERGEILAPEAGVGVGGGSLWSLIVEAVLWGFAALLTPCVFPMVPMTVSFFMEGSQNVTTGRLRASAYGIFIISLYTLPIAALILITRFVGGEAVTADIFNWIATHWIPNVFFFLVFMIFAASFFGAFEITLPSWMVNKSDSGQEKKGLLGVFFMALTLVLVSFSCTGPIVGIVIIKSTSGGEIWAPIITMFAFSVAFALPFTLLAFFPALLNKMPKSGGWLNSVKVTLGFIEVALGFKFLSVADQTYHWGILDREVYLAIWIVTFALMGLYFLGKIKFKHDSDVKFVSVGRLGLAILTFAFVVYLIPGMWGAPLKALSGYMPPMHTHDFQLGQIQAAGAVGDPSAFDLGVDEFGDRRKPKHSEYLSLPHNLQGFFDLEEAQEYARKVGKPLFVDITGHGCVNCREMEARVWADPSVLGLLRSEYVVVALYVDDKMILPESEWFTTDTGRVLKGLGKINAHIALDKFGQNAQPFYVILGDEGQMLVPPRGYDLSIPGFEQFLLDGVREYKNGE